MTDPTLAAITALTAAIDRFGEKIDRLNETIGGAIAEQEFTTDATVALAENLGNARNLLAAAGDR